VVSVTDPYGRKNGNTKTFITQINILGSIRESYICLREWINKNLTLISERRDKRHISPSKHPSLFDAGIPFSASGTCDTSSHISVLSSHSGNRRRVTETTEIGC
jgi:hypothetical protein